MNRRLGLSILLLGTFACSSDVSGPTIPATPSFSHVLPAEPISIGGLGTAQIDGVRSPGEWDGAGTLPIVVEDPGGALEFPGEFLVMNDSENLFFSFSVAAASMPQQALLTLFFDQDRSGHISPGEDGLALTVVSSGGMIFSDWHAFDCSGNNCYTNDFQAGGSTDGNSAFTFTDGHLFAELSHPLDSGDPLDMGVEPGESLGFFGQLAILDQGQFGWAYLGVYFPEFNILELAQASPAALLERLVEDVEALPLPPGPVNALTSKLDAAYAALSRGDLGAMRGSLHAFLRQVQALVRSGRLDADVALSLTEDVDSLLELVSEGA